MQTKQQSGFTLVELAVVVFLVGLLAAVGLEALIARAASASISTTKKKQETIKDALITYLGRNKRLPCPAAPNAAGIIDGTETLRNPAFPYNCTGYFGILPYATLGLPRSAALDGWENFFSYAISPQWTLTYSTAAPTPANSTNVASNAFNVGNLGTLIVSDRAPLPTSPPIQISNPAAAFIVSHGKNGQGAFTSKGTQNVQSSGADEVPNAPVAGAWSPPVAPGFYQREYNDTSSTSYFDDITLMLNPIDLITPLVKDGALKSAEAQWAEQVANIQDWVASRITPPPLCTVPPLSNMPANLQIDPWGNQLMAPGPVATFTYSTGGTFSSSVVQIYTLTNTTPSATPPSDSPSGAKMIRIYPFLINGCP